MEEKLKQAVKHFDQNGKKLELILFIFPYKGGFLYDKIKQLCDMKYSIVTQCCLKGTIFKNDVINKQVLGNICLKINSKLGGINHILASTSRCGVSRVQAQHCRHCWLRGAESSQLRGGDQDPGGRTE